MKITSKKGLKLAVCLPTRNEKESIQLMIDKLRALGFYFYIVDEHSTDGTQEIARKNKVDIYQRDCSGKGCGVIKAIELAHKKGYDLLAFIDCDCTYPAEKLHEMLEYFPDYDMVIGARDLSQVRVRHRLPNKIHTLAINLLYGSKFKDINSGLRILKIDKFYSKLDAHGFDIEAQITLRSAKDKMKVLEIPIEYKVRRGDSKIRIKDGFIILIRIIKDRFRP